MSFFSENPGIAIVLLGGVICVIAVGVSPFGMSAIGIGDFTVEGGPEGVISGPLFTLGVIIMIIGAHMQIRS